MAEITTSGKSPKGKRKILSTRVDLTPMVDLGFLLLTFFVFTTTLSKAHAMRLLLPKDDEKVEPMPLGASGALTLIADEHKVYYYQGELNDAVAAGHLVAVGYEGNKGVRKVILDLKHALIQKNGDDKKLMILIKALPSSNLRNTVDLLDEMTINAVHSYMMVNVSPEEAALAKASN